MEWRGWEDVAGRWGKDDGSDSPTEAGLVWQGGEHGPSRPHQRTAAGDRAAVGELRRSATCCFVGGFCCCFGSFFLTSFQPL